MAKKLQKYPQQILFAISVVLDMLNESPELTAILTPQQSGVLGVLKAVEEKGLKIPDDISVIGLLEDSVGELITPPLSTISFPAQQLGTEAARIIAGQLEGAVGDPQQVLLRPTLNVRGSTGPVRPKEPVK